MSKKEVVITAVGPGRMNYIKEAGLSVLKAFERVGGMPLWIISGSKVTDWDHIENELSSLFHVVRIKNGSEPIVLNDHVASYDRDPVPVVVLQEWFIMSSAAQGRNMAGLIAPVGSLLFNLDADDLFTPERFLLVDDLMSFGVCEAADLLVSGELVNFPSSSLPSVITRGWLDVSRENGVGGLLDVHMATLSIQREVLINLGGYPALPVCEDTVFASRLSAAGVRGFVSKNIGYYYHKHEGQTTSHDYSGEGIIREFKS